jgi:Fe(3+) dicitrate transport protein
LGLAHTSGWDISGTLSHFGSFFTDPANTKDLTVANEDGEILAAGDELEIREPIILGEVKNHTLLSARASYTLPNSNTTFWIQGRNLTDKRYIVDLENGIRPGAERTVSAGVKLEF